MKNGMVVFKLTKMTKEGYSFLFFFFNVKVCTYIWKYLYTSFYKLNIRNTSDIMNKKIILTLVIISIALIGINFLAASFHAKHHDLWFDSQSHNQDSCSYCAHNSDGLSFDIQSLNTIPSNFGLNYCSNSGFGIGTNS